MQTIIRIEGINLFVAYGRNRMTSDVHEARRFGENNQEAAHKVVKAIAKNRRLHDIGEPIIVPATQRRPAPCHIHGLTI